MDKGGEHAYPASFDNKLHKYCRCEQEVHDPAEHALLVHMYRFAKAIDAKSRDPRIPLLLPAQLVRDDKQRDREDQPVEEAALSIVPNCRKSVDKLPPGRYYIIWKRLR